MKYIHAFFRMQTLKIFLAFLVCAPIFSYIQAQRKSPEALYVDFDKDFYVAGEDIWYNVYFMEPAKKQSNIVYAELINATGDVIIRQILKTDGASAKGDMIIPSESLDGYYRFRAYTEWNLNFSPQEIFRKDLPVYSLERSFRLNNSLQTPDIDLLSGKGIALDLDKSVFGLNETVNLSIENTDFDGQKGNLSVSILDIRYANAQTNSPMLAELAARADRPRPQIAQGESLTDPEKKLKYTFIIKHPDTEEMVNSNFIEAFLHQSQQNSLQVATDGIVEFEFDDFYESSVMQIFDANPFHPTYIPVVDLLAKASPVIAQDLNTGTPPMTDMIRHYILDTQQRYVIDKLFEVSSNMTSAKRTENSATLVPSIIYKAEDYVATENTEILVNDLIPPTRVLNKKIKNKETGQTRVEKELSLYLPNKRLYYTKKEEKPPLVRVNKYFTYNVNEVMRIDPKNLRDIEIYNEFEKLASQFGPIGNFGVVAFNTHDGETPSIIRNSRSNITLDGLYLPRTYDIESGRASEKSSVPKFKPLMYWNPQVELSGEEATLSFSAGDRPGTYLVRVEGILEDGSPVFAEAIMKVGVEK